MNSRDIFVGRETELGLIDKMVFDTGGRGQILRILGEGGVGKTWLFRAIEQRYQSEPDVLILKVDYVEVRFYSLPAVTRILVDQLSPYLPPTAKRKFDRQLADLEQFLKTETDPDKIKTRENQFYHLTTSELIAEVSQKKRILILMDTAEAIDSRLEYACNLASILVDFPNTAIVVAGRPTDFVKQVYDCYSTIFAAWEVHPTYTLTPFSLEETTGYLHQALGTTKIDDELCQKIFLLTEGRSILIAITAEWLKRNIDLPEDINLSVQELQALSKTQLKKYRQRFEFELVDRVRRLSRQIDWAILYLAYLDRRYDPRILALALDIQNPEELQTLTADLKTMVFVRKSISAEKIVLHDEARRLFLDYVWPMVDPMGDLRRELASKVINSYYLPEIKQLDQVAQSKLKKNLEKQMINLSGSAGPLLALTDIWLERASQVIPDEEWLRRELQIECLDYYFRLSDEAGWEYRDEIFGEATGNRYSPFQLEAIQQAIEILVKQTDTPLFQLHLAETRLHKGELDQAAAAAQKVLSASQITLVQASRAFRVLGDTTHDPDEIIDYFQKALEKAQSTGQPDVEAVVYNDLGLTYRRQGQWDKAKEAYKKALSLLDKPSSIAQYANTLNNLAYVHLLNGDLYDAREAADRALKIREERGDTRGLSLSYATKGHIAAAVGSLDSIRYFQLGLEYCLITRDEENLAVMQVNMAEVERRASNFDKARQLLLLGLNSGTPWIKARALSETVEIDLAEALALTRQKGATSLIEAKYDSGMVNAKAVLELAKKNRDANLMAKALFQLALLKFYKDGEEDHEHLNELDKLLETHNYILEKGRVEELTGHLAFKRGDTMKAFKKLLKACKMFASYRPQSFWKTFERVRDEFWRAKPEDQVQICQMIEEELKGISPDSSLNALKKLRPDEFVNLGRM